MSEIANAAPAANVDTQNTQNQPNQPTHTQGTEQIPAPQPRKMKLKVDGQEQEYDEAEVIRRAQLSSTAYKRIQEAQRERQQAEEFINKLKTKPFEVIDDPRLGLSQEQKIKLIEDWYRKNVMEESTLTPEQKRLRDQEAELKKYRDQEKAKADKEHQDRLQMLEQHHLNNYKTVIRDALKVEGLPNNEFCAKRMATLLFKNSELGLDMTPADVARLVKEDYIQEMKSLFGSSDGDVLLNLMGDDITNKIRKADLARLRGGVQPESKPAFEATSKPVQGFKRLVDKEKELMKKLGGE